MITSGGNMEYSELRKHHLIAWRNLWEWSDAMYHELKKPENMEYYFDFLGGKNLDKIDINYQIFKLFELEIRKMCDSGLNP